MDGVLTDGRLYLGDDGTEFKAFHVRDGHGFKLLREAGIKVAALSGRRSSAVTRRMDELQVDMYRQGCQHKDRDFCGAAAALWHRPRAPRPTWGTM